MSKADPTPTTPARWPAPVVRNPGNPKPVPPIWDPTRRPPPPPSGRRGLLSGVAAAVLGGAVASCVLPGTVQALPDQFPTHGGRVATTSPDAELIALCEEYVALDRAFCANCTAGAHMLANDPEWIALNEEGCAMVPRLHELEAEIATWTAETPEGLRALVQAARHSLSSDAEAEDAGEERDLLPDTEVAWAALDSVLAMLGAGKLA